MAQIGVAFQALGPLIVLALALRPRLVPGGSA